MAALVEKPCGDDRPAIGGVRPLFEQRVPIVRSELPEEAIRNGLGESLQKILQSGMLTNNRQVERFERLAAEHLGVAHCVAVSSCTAGLMLTLRCLELRGEIILPSFTFFASAHAAVWNGLEPVLADCDAETFNIDPEEVRRAITPRTSAILGVHIFGNPAPSAELEAIARKYGLQLVFDAAHGFGSRAGGRSVGGAGDAEVFSLSPTKLLVAGEGGLVATNREELARRLRAARNYGDAGTYDCEVLGLNARLTEMQAALGIAGLGGLEARVERRNRHAALYETRLAAQPGLAFQRIGDGCRSSRKDFAVLIEEGAFGVSRDFLHAALARDNVETRKYFDPPLHRQRLYRDCRRGELPNTESISRRALSLPIYSSLATATVDAIAGRILEIRDLALAQSRVAAEA